MSMCLKLVELALYWTKAMRMNATMGLHCKRLAHVADDITCAQSAQVTDRAAIVLVLPTD
jgi:hypothetical protein